MKYDFETLVNRTGTGSEKWDMMRAEMPDIPSDIFETSASPLISEIYPKAPCQARPALRSNASPPPNATSFPAAGHSCSLFQFPGNLPEIVQGQKI